MILQGNSVFLLGAIFVYALVSLQVVELERAVLELWIQTKLLLVISIEDR